MGGETTAVRKVLLDLEDQSLSEEETKLLHRLDAMNELLLKASPLEEPIYRQKILEAEQQRDKIAQARDRIRSDKERDQEDERQTDEDKREQERVSRERERDEELLSYERERDVKLKVSDLSSDMFKVLEFGESKKSSDFGDTLATYTDKSPELQKLLHEVLNQNAVPIRFDKEAKDAHFDGSDGSNGSITLPLKNSGADIVDGLLFELYNAKNKAAFDALDNEFRKKLETDPIAFAEYGQRKAKVESETILKNAQMLCALQQAKAPLAYQGQRNLDKMAQTFIKARLSDEGDKIGKDEKSRDQELLDYLGGLLSVTAEEGLLNPPPRVKAHDEAIEKLLQGLLPTLDNPENKATKDMLVVEIMNTPHSAKAEDFETNKLTTRDMYAYQQMEVQPGQLQKMITTQLKKASAQKGSTEEIPGLDQVEKWITDRLVKFEVGTSDEKFGRQKILLDILDEIPRLYPELADELDLSCFEFTPAMKQMAETRFEKLKSENGALWDNIKDGLPPPKPGAKQPGGDEQQQQLLSQLKDSISDHRPKGNPPAIEGVLKSLGVADKVGMGLRMAWEKIAGATGRSPIGLGSPAPNKKLLLVALQGFDKLIESIGGEEVKKALEEGLAVPLRRDVELLDDEVEMEVPYGGKTPPTSPPTELPDEDLKKFTRLGVPRALVKNTSKECLEAILKLKEDEGSLASEGYKLLWAVLGKPKADMIRVRLAENGPHAEKNRSKLALSKLFDQSEAPSKEVVERYKKQMAKTTGGDFEPYVKMSEDHLTQNAKEYPETQASCEAIRKLPEEQRVALYKYTQEKYNQFNGQVLFPASGKEGKGPKPADLEEQIDALTLTRAALDGLPPFKGTVWRADERKYYEDYLKGSVVSRFSLTSTAAAKGSELSGSKYDCSMEIETTTGRDISGCSLKPAEKEILIPPGASFRVIARDDQGGVLKLKLVEV